ncbi:MAG: hypothetical protein JWO56_3392 [Acidobacteria bacterium]|nr:hypothetical protein [Acidobacteriota bacterium]
MKALSVILLFATLAACHQKAPAPVVPIALEPQLLLTSNTRCGTRASTSVDGIPAPAYLFVLAVHFQSAPYVDYQVILKNDENGKVLWSHKGVRLVGDEYTISLFVPKELLPAGRYRIEVWGIFADGKSEELPPYNITTSVTYPKSSPCGG